MCFKQTNKDFVDLFSKLSYFIYWFFDNLSILSKINLLNLDNKTHLRQQAGEYSTYNILTSVNFTEQNTFSITRESCSVRDKSTDNCLKQRGEIEQSIKLGESDSTPYRYVEVTGTYELSQKGDKFSLKIVPQKKFNKQTLSLSGKHFKSNTYDMNLEQISWIPTYRRNIEIDTSYTSQYPPESFISSIKRKLKNNNIKFTEIDSGTVTINGHMFNEGAKKYNGTVTVSHFKNGSIADIKMDQMFSSEDYHYQRFDKPLDLGTYVESAFELAELIGSE
jgi:hypothetical protein